MRPAVALLLLGAAVGAPASPAAGQLDLEYRGDPIAWQYVVTAPAGTLRGLILSDGGLPVAEALVYIDGEGRALSGEDGSFEVEGLSPGRAVFSIGRIGFSTVSDTLVIPSDVGIWISAVLPHTAIGGRCGDLVFRGDGIFADVRDASTDAPPGVPVTLRLSRGDKSWQVTETLVGAGGGHPLLVLRHRIEEPGHFRIEVSAPGYETWERDEVFLEPEWAVCSVSAEGRRVSVRLRPLSVPAPSSVEPILRAEGLSRR